MQYIAIVRYIDQDGWGSEIYIEHTQSFDTLEAAMEFKRAEEEDAYTSVSIYEAKRVC